MFLNNIVIIPTSLRRARVDNTLRQGLLLQPWNYSWNVVLLGMICCSKECNQNKLFVSCL